MDRRRVRPPQQRRQHFDFDDVVYGIHAVDEALAAGERLRSLHVADDRKRDAALRVVLSRAKDLSIPVRFESREFFAKLPFKAHQGVVGIAPPFPYVTLAEAIGTRDPARPRTIVLLDHLTDPHNVGAIVRTAECTGVNGVVLPDRRSAGINATVRKAAAGAAAHVPIARVGNLADAIRVLKKAGFWVGGADAAPGAVEMTKADLRGDVALAIGAEGSGLSPLIRRECDYLVKIPLRGSVASLNASVAAGVLLYEVLRQRDAAAASG